MEVTGRKYMRIVEGG
jgi:hypothetical protein